MSARATSESAVVWVTRVNTGEDGMITAGGAAAAPVAGSAGASGRDALATRSVGGPTGVRGTLVAGTLRGVGGT